MLVTKIAQLLELLIPFETPFGFSRQCRHLTPVCSRLRTLTLGQAEDRRGGRFGVVGVDEQERRDAEDAEQEEMERKKHKVPGAFR